MKVTTTLKGGGKLGFTFWIFAGSTKHVSCIYSHVIYKQFDSICLFPHSECSTCVGFLKFSSSYCSFGRCSWFSFLEKGVANLKTKEKR